MSATPSRIIEQVNKYKIKFFWKELKIFFLIKNKPKKIKLNKNTTEKEKLIKVKLINANLLIYFHF